jgi:hypothetical protein
LNERCAYVDYVVSVDEEKQWAQDGGDTTIACIRFCTLPITVWDWGKVSQTLCCPSLAPSNESRAFLACIISFMMYKVNLIRKVIIIALKYQAGVACVAMHLAPTLAAHCSWLNARRLYTVVLYWVALACSAWNQQLCGWDRNSKRCTLIIQSQKGRLGVRSRMCVNTKKYGKWCLLCFLQLVLNEKGIFNRHRTYVLHQGEGPIRNIKWKGSCIAWANDLVRITFLHWYFLTFVKMLQGVKVYDMNSKSRITFINKDNPKWEPLDPR